MKAQLPRTIPFEYHDVRTNSKQNDNIRVQSTLGHRLNRQFLSFFNNGAATDHRWCNSFLDTAAAAGTDRFASALQIEVDNKNVLQASLPNSAQFNSFVHMNMPKQLKKYSLNNLFNYNSFISIDYCDDGEENMDGLAGKSLLDQERYLSYQCGLAGGEANHLAVVINSTTKILEYSEDLSGVRVI